MASTVTATLGMSTTVTHSSTNDLGPYSGAPKLSYTTTLSTSDISLVYSKNRNPSTAESLDLSNGSLTNQYGETLTFTTLKSVIIQNTHATATLTIGGGTNPLFGTDQYTVKAGHCLAFDSQFAIDSTHKQITVTPSAASTYSIILLGS